MLARKFPLVISETKSLPGCKGKGECSIARTHGYQLDPRVHTLTLCVWRGKFARTMIKSKYSQVQGTYMMFLLNSFGNLELEKPLV